MIDVAFTVIGLAFIGYAVFALFREIFEIKNDCAEMGERLEQAMLDYKSKTAAIRKKGWETRRRKKDELAARQLEIPNITEKEAGNE